MDQYMEYMHALIGHQLVLLPSQNTLISFYIGQLASEASLTPSVQQELHDLLLFALQRRHYEWILQLLTRLDANRHVVAFYRSVCVVMSVFAEEGLTGPKQRWDVLGCVLNCVKMRCVEWRSKNTLVELGSVLGVTESNVPARVNDERRRPRL